METTGYIEKVEMVMIFFFRSLILENEMRSCTNDVIHSRFSPVIVTFGFWHFFLSPFNRILKGGGDSPNLP